MDNTRVISSNGSVVYGNEKMIGLNGVPLQKSVNHHHPQHRFDHRKVIASNTGSMFTIGSTNGARILMNSNSIETATNWQFTVPHRSKSSVYNGLPSTMPSIKFMHHTILSTPQANTTTQTALLSAGYMKPFCSYTNTTPNVTSRSTSDLMFEEKQMVISRNSISLHETTTTADDFYTNDQPNRPQDSSNEQTNQTLVGTIKNFFTSLIKPLIDTKTMIVGGNSGKVWSLSATSTPKSEKSMFDWSKRNDVVDLNKSLPAYYDNHSSDSFCFSSEQSNYYVNYMPDTYFDCDDYLDGGEDTIDFVAASTKLPTHFNDDDDDDLINESPVHKTPTDNNVFYDCINKLSCSADVDAVVASTVNFTVAAENDQPSVKMPEQQTVTAPKNQIEHLDVVSKCPNDDDDDDDDDDKIIKSVQYDDKKLSMNCPKYEKPNRNAYRQKRKGRRKSKTTNRHKGSGAQQKNRHEKIRHEVAMNIHDDCFTDDEHEADTDLEIIDVDETKDESSHPAAPSAAAVAAEIIECTPTKSMCTETPIPSPEVIPSGCIFTRFFRFDRSDCKPKSLPLRCKQPKQQFLKETRERATTSTTGRRCSENSESDDSFIIFEESSNSSSPRSTSSIIDDLMLPKHATLKDTYRRQRQISECSDDFILFEDDDNNDYEFDQHRYDTTDEDFTDSTDDSDNSEDESGGESDFSEYIPTVKRKPNNQPDQPDSGFEEKKVTFNLCPTVHEIRAWKFAYSEARKGKWEQLGRDRDRFEKRINGLSRILTPVLNAKHRQKIYEQRFGASAE